MTEEIDIKAKVLVDGLQEIGVFMCLSDFHLNILVKEVLRRIGCVSRFAPAFLMRCAHLPTKRPCRALRLFPRPPAP